MQLESEFRLAFKLTTPTLFALIPLGMLFSILWMKAGFPGFWAPIMSMFAYAGAMQLIALSMMQDNASILSILLAVIFIGARNTFYGLSLIERFKSKPKLVRFFLIFGLIDSTYGVLSINPENPKYNDTKFCLYTTMLPYIYWVLGTIIGTLLFVKIPINPNIGFMLVCFFMVIALDLFMISRDILSLIIPVVLTLISFVILPQQYFILSIIFSIIFIHFNENYRNKKLQEASS